MHKGLVSVVIPVHNRPGLVGDAVRSVIRQTYRPIEIVIIDDGSTDHTPAVLESLAARHPEIRILSQPNLGPGAARELGRRDANGEFLQYLDSDDLLLPRKLEWQVAGLRARTECGASYGWTRYRHENGDVEVEPCKGTGVRIERMFPAFLKSRPWHTSTPLYRSTLCARAGPWLPLSQEEDWEYDCRIAALDVRLHYVPEFLSETRDHEHDRLSRDSLLNPQLLADRARAHERILDHALRAGVAKDSPEMRHFARELFLLCRQCGDRGLRAEAAMLHALAARASVEAPFDLRAYGLAAQALGWTTAGKLATMVDRFRP